MASKVVEFANSPLGQSWYRIMTSVSMLILNAGVVWLISSNLKTQEALGDFKFTTGIVVAEMKGKLEVVDKRIDAQGRRIDEADTDRRVIWTRLFELVQKAR